MTASSCSVFGASKFFQERKRLTRVMFSEEIRISICFIMCGKQLLHAQQGAPLLTTGSRNVS